MMTLKINNLFFFSCVLLFASSCSVETINDIVSDEDNSSYEQMSYTSSGNSGFSVTPTMILDYVRFASKEKMVGNIEPIIRDGDTLAYYVQYSNDGGWDLMAADTRMDPILVSSPSGSLYSSELFFRDIALETVNTVKVVKQSRELTVKKMWDYIKRLDTSKSINKQSGDPAKGLAQGMWIPVDTVFAFDTTTSNRIISTKWGQSAPWYWYTPVDPYSYYQHTLVGCVPVAVGQILYRYLYLTNGLYNIPDSVGFDYYGNPLFISFTTDWSGFAETSDDTNNAAIIKTAKFLSWIGNSIGTEYHLYNSPSLVKNAVPFMSQYLDFDSSLVYDSNIILSNLSASKPVFISAGTSPSDEYGHSFIIDAYKIISYQMVINYEFDPYHEVTEEEYHNNPYWMFQWPSPAQFPDYDPDKEPAIMPVATNLSSATYFMMNWGNDGLGDDAIFSSYSLNWNYQGSNYSFFKKMFYNFARKN